VAVTSRRFIRPSAPWESLPAALAVFGPTSMRAGGGVERNNPSAGWLGVTSCQIRAACFAGDAPVGRALDRGARWGAARARAHAVRPELARYLAGEASRGARRGGR